MRCAPYLLFAAMLSFPRSGAATEPPGDSPPGTLDELDKVETEPVQEAPPTGASSLLNPRISLIGSFAGSYFSGEPTYPGGHDPHETGFLLQEIELAIQASVDPYFDAEVYLAFSQGGVEVEEAFARTTGLPVVQIAAGLLKSQFGRHNRRHLEQWRFADSPLITKALLGEEGLAALGGAIEVLPPVGPSLRLRLEVLDAGEGGHGHEAAAETEAEEEEPELADRLVVVARAELGLDLGPATAMLIGGSFAARGLGEHSVEHDERQYLAGGDLTLRYLPATDSFFAVAWQTEYLARIDAEDASGGLYSELSFRVLQWLELAGRFDAVGLPEGDLVRELGGALAMTFLPSEFSRIRLQGGVTSQKGQDDPVASVILQLQFNLGPHGAHAF